MKKVGIVVPTLGKRPEYLAICLQSIKDSGKKSGSAFVVLVAPDPDKITKFIEASKFDKIVKDEGLGLAGAINAGFAEMPDGVKFLNWIGDDDYLEKGSLDFASLYLESKPKTTMVFGQCTYVDHNGNKIFMNKSGKWAVPLLHFGPDMIPQPGALFRRDAFEKVGRLNQRYSWAFDFDLFIRFSKIGTLEYLKRNLAYFRWHPDSLSVEFRSNSVSEASLVRLDNMAPIIKKFSWIWEPIMRGITFYAGSYLSRRISNEGKKL